MGKKTKNNTSLPWQRKAINIKTIIKKVKQLYSSYNTQVIYYLNINFIWIITHVYVFGRLLSFKHIKMHKYISYLLLYIL